ACHTPGKRRDTIDQGAILVRLAFFRDREPSRYYLFTRPSRAICRCSPTIDYITHNFLITLTFLSTFHSDSIGCKQGCKKVTHFSLPLFRSGLYVTLSLHLSHGPLKLCVVLYVIYVGGWLGVQRIRQGRRGGGFVMVARFI